MNIAGVSCRRMGDQLIIEITGDIDHHSAKYIREQIDHEIFASHCRVAVMELGRVDFMDSSGLGLILGRYTRMREIGGLLKLSNPSPQTVKILALAGADKLIPITYNKMEESKK